MKVAVLGGGIAGVCTALALAERGIAVDVYERHDALVSRASYWNEGKIHLGFVYAQDTSRRSTEMMLQGALSFRPLLTRWIEATVLERALSTPFVYAVHRDTMVPVRAVEAHFHATDEAFAAAARDRSLGYVARTGATLWRRQDAAEHRALFDEAMVIASYQTEERSVDPFCVATALRQAVAAAPGITVLTGATVRGVRRLGRHGYDVVSEQGETPVVERYAEVVNALWQNRLGIDQALGRVEQRPVMHRFKVGLHSRPSLPLTVPSVTFVSGPFGDTVGFSRRAYVNWYPAGLLATSHDAVPALSDAEVLAAGVDAVESASLGALSCLFAGEASNLAATAGHWDVGGGYISAWACTGIDHPDSRLHQRFNVGVDSADGYHSIDTGKYTLGPYFARVACERIAPARTMRRPVGACRVGEA